MATMDAMAANGLRAAGYNYVNLDDCVVTGRFDNGMVCLMASNPAQLHAWSCIFQARLTPFLSRRHVVH
jgi:hypothetical protein